MKIGVIGAGTMGQGIAKAFAQVEGNTVALCDIKQEWAENGLAKIKKGYEKLVAKGKMTQEKADAIVAAITPGLKENLCADCDLVVEAAFEDMKVKQTTFGELDKICKPECVFASNTSSLSITEIGKGLSRPLIGMHFFNPADRMKLIEVIAGCNTPAETVEKIKEISVAIGKQPVQVNEAAGFVVNRILIPMINEAAFIKMEGVSDIQGIPIVKDKSGKGNDGIIRGNPTLVKYNGGWGLSLDGVDDYVEIPDNKNYVVDNGVTGMVWANIDRLATGDEWDHNPLLMKGASISYGTNYLFRMAVRKTGMVTYGIGFNNDNGEYFWNDDENMGGGVTLGKWVQYTGGFDRATGGDSYEDTKASGHIDAPDFDSEIRNWEGRSMYSGFAFHRHLLTDRGRGKTHTMLTGDIGQLRFYTTKLTAEENKQIYANPTAKGPESDKLVVWLDYAPENIVTKGTHTTEWRAMTGSAAQFTYNAEITGAASATATVETSDDGKTVKASQSAELKNGKNTVDISALGSAKYVRVTTVLNSSVAEKSTDIPVINSYSIKAGNTNIWATLADWNEGTFTDAVGYESDDVFNDYSVDYDDYGTVGKNVKVVEGTVSTFTDIAGHWAKDAIEYVTDKALFNGTTATTFSPNEGMTRGMFVTVLGRMAGADISTYNTQSQFADVDSKMYYNAYVNWAAANKIVSGVDASHFNPNALITREQAAVIMDNYLTATGTKVEETGSAAAFADSASIRAYAKDAVTRMQKAGLLSGKSGNRFDPQGTATRAQVAVIMQNLCEKTGK